MCYYIHVYIIINKAALEMFDITSFYVEMQIEGLYTLHKKTATNLMHLAGTSFVDFLSITTSHVFQS